MSTSSLSTLSLQEKFDRLKLVVEKFKNFTFKEKISFFEKNGYTLSENFSEEQKYIVCCLKFLDQWERLSPYFKKKEPLLDELFSLDTFYQSIGGILGYHLKMLGFLKGEAKATKKTFFPPESFDLRSSSKEVYQNTLLSLEKLPEMAEIYPLGGAADRLHLVDEKTKEPLPAAKLPFAGKGLLRVLVEDVEAREYLYFKLFKKGCKTPICLMTSNEKNNHTHIQSILEKSNWFNRGKESFYLFSQPSVPTMDEKGNLCIEKMGMLKKKPGGHGVLWKLLLDKQLYPILRVLGRKKALVRQINNPIAGVDYTLLAFMGHGLDKDLDFGFIGCDPLEGTKEGRNVLVEEESENGFLYFLSNIEYCQQVFNDSCENKFLSNTNLLFCDLAAVEKAVQKKPFPGALLNFKEGVCLEKEGVISKKVARLEATMQNISDSFSIFSEKKLKPPKLNSFVGHAERLEALSPAKNVYRENGSLVETPEKAFYDLIQNAKNLLDSCGVVTPTMNSLREDILKPSFIFLYHPALGPLYSIIRQKIKGGGDLFIF